MKRYITVTNLVKGSEMSVSSATSDQKAPSDVESLRNKIVVVTGASSGLGLETAKQLASRGAEVVMVCRNAVRGEQARSWVTEVATGRPPVMMLADLSVQSDVRRVANEISSRYDRIDILINNAGIWITGRLSDTSEADYRRVIDVNQLGVFLGMQAVSKPMIAARSGAIVNISSVAGLRGAAAGFAYGASKWAVRGMTKSAARELGPYGIRVNSIHPGLIETAMLHQLPGIDANMEERVRAIPLARLGEAEDVAKLALFLASEDSAYSTGAEFIIDGGLTS